MSDQLYPQIIERIVKHKIDFGSLVSACDELNTAGKKELSINLYKTWLNYNANDPALCAILFNLGCLLSDINDLAGARDAFVSAIAAKQDFVPAHINLGRVLERLGATGEAVNQWLNVLNIYSAITADSVNYKISALNQIGRVLERTHLEESAEDALRQSIEIRQDPDAIQHWTALRQRQCKWPVLSEIARTPRNVLFSGMSPYCILFHTDDPLLHLARGFAFHKRKIGRPVLSFHAQHLARRKAPRKSGRIRIGYLSSYLREHAHGYLTAEMYRLHDRDKVEVFAYSCSGRTLDRIQTRIMDGVDHWIDIDDLTDEQSARRIFDDQIDILVDFNGYTGDARVKIMSMRPAPIIVNWLGYPATTGTPYHDYIIADDFIIPTGYEKYYSEKVLRLPCYQPNDRLRLVADRQWTRAAAGLPERGVVFCAFNGIQKVTAFMWRRYMAILDQVPGSALWLLEGKETTNQRLRAMAEAQGIAGERIVFAPPLVNAEHLARFAMADLFLDTSPYGAHTTASDALWMGVPVLTAPGRSFAARVCGSLVAAAGIGELICDSLDDYVGKAVQLGRDRDRLAALRKKIIDNRDTCDLFNTKKLVSHLDDIFLQMWSEYSRGKTPRPDLSNLEIYDEIGTELDRDEVEMQSVADYESLYLQRLRERDDYFPINPDKRLWQRKK